MFSVGTRVLRAAATAAGTVAGGSILMASAACNPAVEVPRCKPVILCGPSGAGKSTLITMLRAEFPDDYGFSVSHTTRAPRPGEVDGEHYHFVDKAAMEKEIAAGLFLEHAAVHGNFYGTSRAAVESVSGQCRSCILDIDIQGVKSCRALGLDVDKYVFIAPPDIAQLEARLRARGTETEASLRKRLDNAVKEMEESKRLSWDGYIVNDDKDKAYVQLRALLAEGRENCMKARAAAAAAAAAAASAAPCGCPHKAAAAAAAAAGSK